MAQSISLDNLLAFQNKQSPSYIATSLTALGGWVTDDEKFENTEKDYVWYKAAVDEQFEPHTKDQIKYWKVADHKAAIAYVTLTKDNFDAVKTLIQSSMSLDKTLVDDPRVKVLKYSGANTVIEMIEPFQPQKDNLFMYVFIAYDKDEYDKGFKIR
ncbi:MAG TPA: hypothetical protein VL728_00995 [Cyclobacteriaceae bacterium]|nr:hypothetical protein [Cyclobacteriaceae bacterium]